MFIISDVFNSPHDLFHGNVLVMLPRESSSGAVTAVHGALVRNKEQNPVRITMGHARNGAELIFSQGIRVFIRRKIQFIRSGNCLFPDRVVRIVKINQRKIIRGHRHSEPPQGRFDPVALFLGQYNAVVLKILYGCGPVNDLPAPVVPVRLGDVCKQSVSCLHCFPSRLR